MLKFVSVCAALILAAATFSTSAEAQHRGPGARMGGAHISGARVGSVGGARMGSMARPGSIGAYGGRGIYTGGRYASGYGRGYGYRYPYRRYGYGYGGYWPWAVGAGLAVAATGAYYGGYGYGYDDCVQWRPDWGWVNVCEYGGYYPY